MFWKPSRENRAPRAKECPESVCFSGYNNLFHGSTAVEILGDELDFHISSHLMSGATLCVDM